MAIRFTGEMTPRGDYIFEDDRGMRMPLRPERARQVAAYTGIDLGVGAPPTRGGPDLRLAFNQPPGAAPVIDTSGYRPRDAAAVENLAATDGVRAALEGYGQQDRETILGNMQRELGPMPTRPELAQGDQRLAQGPRPDYSRHQTKNDASAPAKPEEEPARRHPIPPAPQPVQPQFRVTPAGVTTSTATTTQRSGPSQATVDRQKAEVEAAAQKQLEALNAQAEAKREEGLARQELFRNQAAELERKRIENETPLREAKARYERYQQLFEQESAELRDTEIDPGGRMDSANTVLAAISVALGELGRGLKGGGPNVALEIINNKINRDINAQKTDLANKRAALSDREQEMLRIAGDVRTYEQQREILEREKYAHALKELENDSNLKGIQPQLAEMRANLEQEAAARKAQLDAQIQQTISSKTVSQTTPESVELVTADPKTVRFRGQPVGHLSDPKMAADLNVEISEYESAMKEIAELKQQVQEGDWEGAGNTQYWLMLRLKNLTKSGALDEGMLKVAEKIIPKNKALALESKAGSLKNLDSFGRRLGSALANKTRNLGLGSAADAIERDAQLRTGRGNAN